jgi:signal transduction histidine kinase
MVAQLGADPGRGRSRAGMKLPADAVDFGVAVSVSWNDAAVCGTMQIAQFDARVSTRCVPRHRLSTRTMNASTITSSIPPATPAHGDDERQRLHTQYAEIAGVAGGLAHEVRNPLSTIHLNVELLREELAEVDDPRVRRSLSQLERIQSECRHLDEILTAFLQFVRAGELMPAETSLNDVVLEFIRFYQPQARQHGIEISPHLAADLPPVPLDAALFRQVLMNLALNAQQAMPQGGLLELQTFLHEGCVCLQVIDNGCGMDDATRGRIFNPFFTTKISGSGLGLPAVRKIVEAHRGRIECDSEPGRGSRFTISLPAADMDEVSDPTAGKGDTASGSQSLSGASG